jgi:CheY-like chemotaxis protein
MERTVLIIDDNEDDVLIAERVLSGIGGNIRTEAASSGEAGLALLRGGKALPALILLDLKMPGMGGIEVLQRIRGDKDMRHIPVVVVTHSDLMADVAASYKAGANAVLRKAVDVDQFRKEVKRVLERWVA